ncbi:MAG TPA: ElyC/SanA/YdcF family protein [Pirellulaceae bacterium]|jgi:uncharacterized SAM-binding protein YcdF (DUF218 family)|nr:ElyC/SanA/YdcF family protein [Pirellulaceae bacterium]
MISPSARRKLIIVAVLAIGGLVLISQRRLLLPPLADWLDVGISPTRADYIMVLPGHSETRPFVAASWVRLGLADQVLLPRTRSSGDIEDGIIPPTHEIEAAVMECCGLHKEQVVILPGESASTFDDAQALAAFIAGQPEARVAIVTSGFHTRRARWVFRQRIPELMDRIQFVSAPNPGFHAKRWWRTPRGLDTVCSEYLKLLFYWCKYGAGLYWMGGGVAGVMVATWIVRRRSVERS